MPADHHGCGIHAACRSRSRSPRAAATPRCSGPHRPAKAQIGPCCHAPPRYRSLAARRSHDLAPTAPPPRALLAPPHAATPPGTAAAAQATGPHDEAPRE
jgi:hypothetical protein